MVLGSTRQVRIFGHYEVGTGRRLKDRAGSYAGFVPIIVKTIGSSPGPGSDEPPFSGFSA